MQGCVDGYTRFPYSHIATQITKQAKFFKVLFMNGVYRPVFDVIGAFLLYFTFGIGNRTSTCILDLFTCNHYLPNGFLLFSTGS